MKTWQRNAILVVALVAFGAARMPFESALSKELRQAGLTPQPLDIEARDKIGQTSSAVALGGLRTLVATFLNLRAFGFFQERRWDDVADTFNTIVALAPRTEYYWEAAHWHLAFDAASDYLYESKMPPLRRREAWRASILKGRAFLERGIRNNPDSWNLNAKLGSLLANRYKFNAFGNPDATFAASAEAYRKAVETGQAPDYVRRAWFFSLARVPGKETEALAMGRSLYEKKYNRIPTVLLLLLVLEAHENPEMDTAKRAVELLGPPEKAYAELSHYWLDTKNQFPVFGVAGALESLEKTLAIPAEKSVFNHPLPPPNNPGDPFTK